MFSYNAFVAVMLDSTPTVFEKGKFVLQGKYVIWSDLNIQMYQLSPKLAVKWGFTVCNPFKQWDWCVVPTFPGKGSFIYSKTPIYRARFTANLDLLRPSSSPK